MLILETLRLLEVWSFAFIFLDDDKLHTLTPVEYLSIAGSEVMTKKKQDSNSNSGIFGQNMGGNMYDNQINMHLFMNGLALPPTST